MLLFWIGLGVMCSPLVFTCVGLMGLHAYLHIRYLSVITRIFLEKPLFIIPRGQRLADAEVVRFPTTDALMLNGCYLKTKVRRRGVILFGLEFGSTCWACWSYVEHLVAAGFDVFAFESRNQGESGKLPGYDPLQWVTEYEVQDTQAALTYLNCRLDAHPSGVGFFGISKGAGAGLLAAVDDPRVRCLVTDGLFATYTTIVPYMQTWVRIYTRTNFLHILIPRWYYGRIGLTAVARIERERHCRFPHLESEIGKLAPRPFLMIHGQGDTYIKPDMARAVFEQAGDPKEFWLVEAAKHNGALQAAGAEYRERVLRFFEQHLADDQTSAVPTPAPDSPLPARERGQPVYSER